MNGFGNWLRNLGYKLRTGFARFMEGRYGTDRLNMAILMTGLGMSILSMFFRIPAVNLVLTGLSYVLMFWAIFRTFSRNTYKRYRENRKSLLPDSSVFRFVRTTKTVRYKKSISNMASLPSPVTSYWRIRNTPASPSIRKL